MKRYDNLKLQELTEKWGKDRLITVNGKIPTQTLKFAEEMGEMFEAQNEVMLTDAIGDMIVVSVMIAQLNGTSLITACNMEFDGDDILKEFKGTPLTGGGLLTIVYSRLCGAVVREQHEKINRYLKDIMSVLMYVCDDNNIDLNDCWNFAYNEIKDRKGKLLENGNFVKEEDEAAN